MSVIVELSLGKLGRKSPIGELGEEENGDTTPVDEMEAENIGRKIVPRVDQITSH